MSWLGELISRRKRNRELVEEIRGHLEEKIEGLVAGGLPREDAEAAARREFGNLTLVEMDSREVWQWPSFDSFVADLRFGLRTLRKKPGFTAIAVLTLALGIAVNATMFSLVSGFLLQKPPGRDPEHVVVVSSVNPAEVFQADLSSISAPNYIAWRDANHVFADMSAANENGTASLSSSSTSQGQPEAVRAAAVTSNYFSVLGATPEVGRTFNEGEDQPGRDHVVILGHDLWERRFGSDPSVVTKTIRLNRQDYSVIGVMPATFRMVGFTPQLWMPLELTAADQSAGARKNRSLYLFARLKPGVTLAQARAEMVRLARNAEESYPDVEKGWGAAARTLPDFLAYSLGIRTGLAVIMTTVGFVLMIACANVAGLLLARAAGRRRELAMRIALGATRLRVVRQMLTEGLVIAFLGCSAGLLLANWGIHFVRANFMFNEVIRAVPLQLDWNVLVFAMSVSLFSALLCGLAPALKAARTDINANLKDESRSASPSHSHTRLRTVLVTGEIALALFLLVGTGLLFRGISLMEHQSLGFRPEQLLTARVTLDDARYKDALQQRVFVQEVIARLAQIPGTDGAAAASELPASGPGSAVIRVKGQPELPANQLLTAVDSVVSADYFRVAGIPLLRGRGFTESDNATAPRVVVVNREFVHRHLKDAEALGKQIRVEVSDGPPEWSEIVGVIGNVKTYSEETHDDPAVYEGLQQRPVASLSLMVRTKSFDPNAVASAVRNELAQIDAELPIERVMSMENVIQLQMAGDPFMVRVLGTFAILALILAGIGIYGLVAYSVGQRTHEIGIRMALGANRRDVLRMVLWEGMKMTAFGTGIGLALALPLPKLFDAIFYNIRFREPGLYFVVPMAIVMVALAATYIPARRATQVDPMAALRQG